MSVIQYRPKVELELSELIQLVTQLDTKELSRFAKEINELVAARTSTLSREEELLKKIDLKLSPTDQKHYDHLRQLMKQGELTKLEHQELLELSDKAGMLNVERMKALVELSKIRNVHIDELMKSLNIFPSFYE